MTDTLITPSLTHLSSEDFDHIYEPAEDSFLFLDALEADISILKSLKPAVCLEVGCGSGVVSTSIAKYLGSSCHVIGSDINHMACDLALKTSRINGTSKRRKPATMLSGKSVVSQVDAVRADLVTELRKDGIIDLLLFNPPYVVTPSDEISPPSSSTTMLHRAWAGGKRGREVTDRLLPEVKQLLASRALFYLVLIDENDPDDVARIMSEQGFAPCIVKSRRVRGEHLSVMRFSRGL